MRAKPSVDVLSKQIEDRCPRHKPPENPEFAQTLKCDTDSACGKEKGFHSARELIRPPTHFDRRAGDEAGCVADKEIHY
jgi:hypothetical protein